MYTRFDRSIGNVHLSTMWKQEVGLAAAIVAIALVGFGFLLEPGVMPYSAHSDLIAEHLPLKWAAYENLRAGEGLPLWRRDMLSGGPALTNPQAVYVHPLQWPFLWMHPAAASGPSLWLHFLFMGLSMQVLGATLGLGFFARVFMSVAGMFSFKMILIAYSGWLPVWPGVAGAPLLVAGVLRVLDRPGPGSTLLLSVAGSLALLSGHLQVPYYVVLFLAGYLLLQTGAAMRAGRSADALRAFSACGIAAVLALASAGYLLVPLASEFDLTARITSEFDFLQSAGAYASENLATFLHPEILGTPLDGSYEAVELWENVAYFGVIAEGLALLGVVFGYRRRHVLFLAVACVFSVLLVFDSFLLRWFHDFVPGFSLFRHPSRFLFLTTLFGIALAGVGLETLLERLRDVDGPRKLPRVALVVAFALIGTSIIEGTMSARRYLPMLAVEKVVPEPGYAKWLAQDPGPFRVAPLQRFAINYGWGALFGLELVTGFEPYNYQHYLRYMEMVATGRVVEPQPVVWTDMDRIVRWDLLDALGVKYVVSMQALKALPHDLEPVASFPSEPIFGFYQGLGTSPIEIYRNPHARPRAWWSQRVVSVASAEEAAEALRVTRADRQAIVEIDTRLPAIGPPAASDVISLLARSASSLTFDASSAQGGFVVISEIWHPGWKATLDGAVIPIRRTNVALMGVAIPAGTHRLVVEFRPLGLELGVALSCSAWIGMFVLGVACLRARGAGGGARRDAPPTLA